MSKKKETISIKQYRQPRFNYLFSLKSVTIGVSFFVPTFAPFRFCIAVDILFFSFWAYFGRKKHKKTPLDNANNVS